MTSSDCRLTGAPTIHVRHAYLAFRDVVLFDDLNLTFRAGKWTCLLGPSGIGKSSLLRLIANLVVADSNPRDKTVIRAEVSTVDQIAYMAQTDLLLPWLSVLDNVLLGTRLRQSVPAGIREHAINLLVSVGLGDAMAAYPAHLSGGMRQRVALVRTLLENKPVVIMDEPFSALDTITRFKLQTLAAALLKDRTVIFVTHDPLEALRLADDIYIMSGLPATLKAPIELTTPTPRDPGSQDVLELQARLFHELASL